MARSRKSAPVAAPVVVAPVATPEAEAAPAVKARTFRPCECGCGGPTQSRFVPGHDARVAAAARWAALAAESGVTPAEAKAAADATRKSAANARAKARREAEKAAGLAAFAAAQAVAAETPEATEAALAAEAVITPAE